MNEHADRDNSEVHRLEEFVELLPPEVGHNRRHFRAAILGHMTSDDCPCGPEKISHSGEPVAGPALLTIRMTDEPGTSHPAAARATPAQVDEEPEVRCKFCGWTGGAYDGHRCERDELRAGVERWREKAQEAGAAYGLANSKHHAELDRANRLERMADTLAGKAVALEDRARAAERALADERAKVAGISGRNATSARARGDSEEERRWLDLSIVLERATLAGPEPEAPRTLGGCMWCNEDGCDHGARMTEPEATEGGDDRG